MEKGTDRLLIGCQLTEIPSNTRSIATYAFYGCEYLEAISIPASVTSIGEEAFNGCISLTSVTVGMRQPLNITGDTFSSRFYATLYVPTGCKALYENAAYWQEFYNIVEVENTDVSNLKAAVGRADAYDLTGRRVSTSQKNGLYIIAGKKVLVK
jgi:hypothetical protein